MGIAPFFSVYPITLEDRWGTLDKFAAIPFHLILFSAALVELAKSIPVHSVILSSHLFFCLPVFFFLYYLYTSVVLGLKKDKNAEKVTKVASGLKKTTTHFQTILKAHVKFQMNWPKM